LLSLKTILSDPARNLQNLREIGIYVSCSVELRSRFWLLNNDTIDRLQVQIIRFFNLLLLEELFDTLRLTLKSQNRLFSESWFFESDYRGFDQAVTERITGSKDKPRLQGQDVFEHLKCLTRTIRWDTWASIRQNEIESGLPDPSLITDICSLLFDYFDFLKNCCITFLIDDYSNQRIPEHLQKKLNQTISFAKQGIPIFKVSSEYQGVNLEGIQEGREVIEVNIGEKYTSLGDNGHIFISDILNRRLDKAGYAGNTEQLLGKSEYSSIAKALVDEEVGRPFYYYGIDCVHQICSGDVALALDLIKKIFDIAGVDKESIDRISPNIQHKAIQQFSHDEIRRIRHVVPFGEEMYDIVCYLGALAKAVSMSKKSGRVDKSGDPVCKTHLDVRMVAIRDLEKSAIILSNMYNLLKSKAILFSIQTSRSRISGETDRLQIRRIYLPAFKAPLKRDVPIKIDTEDDLKSLLTNPQTFTERELKRSDIDVKQLGFAFMEGLIRPREK